MSILTERHRFNRISIVPTCTFTVPQKSVNASRAGVDGVVATEAPAFCASDKGARYADFRGRCTEIR
ncbi:hypothetical protein [Variovorax gossypii]|jgi:hypothetical protein